MTPALHHIQCRLSQRQLVFTNRPGLSFSTFLRRCLFLGSCSTVYVSLLFFRLFAPETSAIQHARACTTCICTSTPCTCTETVIVHVQITRNVWPHLLIRQGFFLYLSKKQNDNCLQLNHQLPFSVAVSLSTRASRLSCSTSVSVIVEWYPELWYTSQ